MYYEEAFLKEKTVEISLTFKGRKKFSELKDKYSGDEKLTQFLTR